LGGAAQTATTVPLQTDGQHATAAEQQNRRREKEEEEKARRDIAVQVCYQCGTPSASSSSMSPKSSEQTSDLDQQPIPERVLKAAIDAFGQGATVYLDAPNYALGGRSPRELLKTTDGQQTVLSEIQAHVGGGPI
jgi:hypothetical protein